MAHTPTPWYLDYGGGYGKGHIYSDAFPVDSLGGKHSLGAVHFPPLYNKEGSSLSKDAFAIAEANAAFIVRACNAHEALLTAARLFVVDGGGGECFCHAGPESAARHALGLGPGPCDYCVAKQAIALAEGGKDGGA